MVMDLKAQLELRSNIIFHDARSNFRNLGVQSVSIGALVYLYDNRHILLERWYRRCIDSRWCERRKTLLIESIFMGIPTGVIYLLKKDDDCNSVLDGMERLLTILDFIGCLRSEDEHKRRDNERFRTFGTYYIGHERNLKYMGDFCGQCFDDFTKEMQNIFMDSKILIGTLSIDDNTHGGKFPYGNHKKGSYGVDSELFTRLNY